MPTPEYFPWISAGLAALALAVGLPALVDLVCGRRRETALPHEFQKTLRANAEALARAAASLKELSRPKPTQVWRGLWDGCPGAWPVGGERHDTLDGPES